MGCSARTRARRRAHRAVRYHLRTSRFGRCCSCCRAWSLQRPEGTRAGQRGWRQGRRGGTSHARSIGLRGGTMRAAWRRGHDIVPVAHPILETGHLTGTIRRSDPRGYTTCGRLGGFPRDRQHALVRREPGRAFQTHPTTTNDGIAAAPNGPRVDHLRQIPPTEGAAQLRGVRAGGTPTVADQRRRVRALLVAGLEDGPGVSEEIGGEGHSCVSRVAQRSFWVSI